MTDADRIAMLEAQLEKARADLDSHVEALDKRIAWLRGRILKLSEVYGFDCSAVLYGEDPS